MKKKIMKATIDGKNVLIDVERFDREHPNGLFDEYCDYPWSSLGQLIEHMDEIDNFVYDAYVKENMFKDKEVFGDISQDSLISIIKENIHLDGSIPLEDCVIHDLLRNKKLSKKLSKSIRNAMIDVLTDYHKDSPFYVRQGKKISLKKYIVKEKK
jgi:hypothetical protein